MLKNHIRFAGLAVMTLACFLFEGSAAASPFGQGVFGADVPFGSATSLSIAMGSTVAVPMTIASNIYSGSGSQVVTVTSTDVVGYKLYVHALSSSNMANTASAAVIPASANSTAAALATDSWGYNTDGSSNYLGMTTASSLLKSASGPYKLGDTTTVTYGAKASATKDAGNYTVSVVYTAVATNP